MKYLFVIICKGLTSRNICFTYERHSCLDITHVQWKRSKISPQNYILFCGIVTSFRVHKPHNFMWFLIDYVFKNIEDSLILLVLEEIDHN